MIGYRLCPEVVSYAAISIKPYDFRSFLTSAPATSCRFVRERVRNLLNYWHKIDTESFSGCSR